MRKPHSRRQEPAVSKAPNQASPPSKPPGTSPPTRRWLRGLAALLALVGLIYLGRFAWAYAIEARSEFPRIDPGLRYQPRRIVDDSGYSSLLRIVKPWPAGSSLNVVSQSFQGAAQREVKRLNQLLDDPKLGKAQRLQTEFDKANYCNFDGDVTAAYGALSAARKIAASDPRLAERELYTIIFYQGVTALRKGENENCILCRGESSCILPIAPAAVHTHPAGSRLAIQHFKEYLERFPEDPEAWWLLNLAYMTLNEYPEKVPDAFLIPLDNFTRSPVSIGKFRDIGHQLGVNRFNQAGGGILDDFDGDGWLDVVVTSFDPTQVMGYYRNLGTGKFEDLTATAGLTEQLGGLYCVQTDYNNDGHLDVFIVRGAWLTSELAMRPSLLRNNGDGTFQDVTDAAGMAQPVNSNSAAWADYDNDGWLDVFVCCEQQPNLLYHNNRDGTFTNLAIEAGVAGSSQFACKGANWFDFDNDSDPDLFVNNMSSEGAQVYRNLGHGKFERATRELKIDGPVTGFACWSWDYDNDGWLDVFATCYERTLNSLVMDVIGIPHPGNTGRLYRNLEGRGFADVTATAKVDGCYATMGCNFGDFNNDGFLDFYLGTGDPNITTLIPNRMFLNQGGSTFADITAASGTGNLQKGHSVACGDWDGDGNVDLFVEMGGAINGDKYHNIMFQNPGQANSWVTVKLIGEKTNRAAVGARLRIRTAGPNPQTIHRVVTSGSSFGANPFELTIGLGDATGIAELAIDWPTSGTRQVFREVPIRQRHVITEFAESYRSESRTPINWAKQ